jgi:undecaprenyl diphosphate synthase
LHLCLAIGYGGRAEITAAIRSLAEAVRRGTLTPAEIDEDSIRNALWLPELPDPEIVIRTGGECRLSNFLLWRVAGSWFHVTRTCWPDFSPEEFRSILLQNQARRLPGTTAPMPAPWPREAITRSPAQTKQTDRQRENAAGGSR